MALDAEYLEALHEELRVNRATPGTVKKILLSLLWHLRNNEMRDE